MEARKTEGMGRGSCGGFLYREGFRPKVSSHAAGQGQLEWNGTRSQRAGAKMM